MVANSYYCFSSIYLVICMRSFVQYSQRSEACDRLEGKNQRALKDTEGKDDAWSATEREEQEGTNISIKYLRGRKSELMNTRSNR